jgi:magnesium chelatase family protein
LSCPCGYLGSNVHDCSCNQKQIQSYRNRVSGPIYDSIDILLSLITLNLNQLETKRESPSQIRKRVEKARKKQYARYQGEICNAKVPFEKLIRDSPLTEKQMKILTQMSTKQNWSNQVQVKVIRLVRTISDLAEKDPVTDESIWGAITLRRIGYQDKCEGNVAF